MTVIDVELPASLEAHEPPEARGLERDGVRLLVARPDGARPDGARPNGARPNGARRGGEVSHHRFVELPSLLRGGDLLVVNTSATLPAAVPVAGGSGLVVHFSTEVPDATVGGWLVEVRGDGGQSPHPGGGPGVRYQLPGSATVTLRTPYSPGRLWIADVDTGLEPHICAYLHRHGRPIRYSYVEHDWGLPYYQTVFATHPGSAEMPSAGRPFTDRMVTRLVSAGVLIAPVLLHTGVASAEAHERPYAERFAVPAVTARLVAHTRAGSGRVIAVGTTVVRALESAVDEGGAHAAQGWTDLVITPERGVRVVDGLLTGLHEPRASHVDLVAAIAGSDLVARSYAEAAAHNYLWHEFGDLNLFLP